jgi:hypothetical protein
MTSVICCVPRSVHAAYKSDEENLGISVVRALYDKRACLESTLGAERVRHTAVPLKPILRSLKGTLPPSCWRR